MTAGLFASLSQEPLDRVTTALGTAFAAEAAAVLPRFTHDDTVCPATFQAGILQAHLMGASAVICGIADRHQAPGQDEALILGIADYLRDQLATYRSSKNG